MSSTVGAGGPAERALRGTAETDASRRAAGDVVAGGVVDAAVGDAHRLLAGAFLETACQVVREPDYSHQAALADRRVVPAVSRPCSTCSRSGESWACPDETPCGGGIPLPQEQSLVNQSVVLDASCPATLRSSRRHRSALGQGAEPSRATSRPRGRALPHTPFPQRASRREVTAFRRLRLTPPPKVSTGSPRTL